MSAWKMGLGVAVLALGGCASADLDDARDLGEYLEFCKELATSGEMFVGEASSTRERRSEYRIVYLNEEYLSFRAEEYEYTGGAHGFTSVTVGTFDRKTGRRLKVADVIPDAKRKDALARLRALVVEKLGGEDQLQSEVTLTENFFIAADGVHFVFNEYEIACYAAGMVEVTL